MSKFVIGCDPELFLRNSSGKMISAVGLIGGTKWEPKKISEVGHAIQEDNVSVEFNIPPAPDSATFINHINFVLDHLKERASALKLEFATNVSAHSFDIDQLCTPEAQTFGCEPDFNAWTGKKNPKPRALDENLRSCGGHIHVGTTLDKVAIIRAMDLFLGVPSVMMDKDTKRRELYGQSGAYRPKSYGVEYRTLSNFWIWSDELKKWVYDQTQRAVDFVEQCGMLPDKEGKIIQRAINNGDEDAITTLKNNYSLCF